MYIYNSKEFGERVKSYIDMEQINEQKEVDRQGEEKERSHHLKQESWEEKKPE